MSLEEKREQLLEQLNKRLAWRIARLEQLERQLQVSSTWECVYHEGQLLQANFHLLKPGLDYVIVEDWERDYFPRRLELDTNLSPQDQIKKIFKKSHKLKAGFLRLPEMISQDRQEIECLQKCVESVQHLQTVEELELFSRENRLTQKKPKEHKKEILLLQQAYREYKSATGLSIFVGKSAKDNDKLTFSFARGSDFWCHVKGFPGSHVILRVEKDKRPDEESIQDALQLAIFFSKATDLGAVEVCLTQRKYLSRFGKNQPGKVQYSKHEIIFTKFDEKRYRSILERK